MGNPIYFKEDTSKPENRVNITLFHLLMIEDIKTYIDKKLGLSKDSVIFPAPDLITVEFNSTVQFNSKDRPDFNIVKNKNIIGYIEVELGKDVAQVKKYNEKTPPNIKAYSIFGRKQDGGDLSLEEIYEFIKYKQKDIPEDCQIYHSMQLFLNLVKYYVIDGNFKCQNKRAQISEDMKKTLIMKSLYESIDKEKIQDEINDKISQGKILINTIKENGFSIRVFSRKSSNKSFSIMARSAGQQIIQFPSFKKLNRYIENKDFVENYTKVLINLGAKDIKKIEENKKETIDLLIVEKHINEIIRCIKILIA